MSSWQTFLLLRKKKKKIRFVPPFYFWYLIIAKKEEEEEKNVPIMCHTHKITENDFWQFNLYFNTKFLISIKKNLKKLQKKKKK